MSFRNPKFNERYEYIPIQPNRPISLPGANQKQRKNIDFQFDNLNEQTPYDLYNSFFEVTYYVSKMNDDPFNFNANGSSRMAQVCGSHSMINELTVKFGGKIVLNTNDINQAVQCKNLVDYSKSYAEGIAESSMFYVEKSREPYVLPFLKSNETALLGDYNEGYKKRNDAIFGKKDINSLIPLNRYSFFEAFQDRVCPSGKFEINVRLEDDDVFLWKGTQKTPANGDQRAATVDGRYVVKSLTLWVPKMVLNGVGGQKFLQNYAKSQSWSYLKENVLTSTTLKTRNDTFKISDTIRRPRHVFVWFTNNKNINKQEANQFIYDTNSIGDAGVKIVEGQLIVGNHKEYPEIAYDFVNEPSRVYRVLAQYSRAYNDYLSSHLLTPELFNKVYPMMYFDLTNQPVGTIDSMVSLAFRFKLSGAVTGAEGYIIRAVVLNEEEISINVESGRALLKA